MKFDSICLYFLTWSPARGSIKIGLIYICQLLTSISDVISECQHCAGTCDWRLLLQPLWNQERCTHGFRLCSWKQKRLWVLRSVKAPPCRRSNRSVWLIKITLSSGSARLPLNSKWERGEPRQRGSHTDGDKSDQCACQPGAVWISYPAAPSAPAIVEDTSASASPACMKGLGKALFSLPGLLPPPRRQKRKKVCFQSPHQIQRIPALLSLQYPAFQK